MLLSKLLFPFKPIGQRVAGISTDMRKLVKQHCTENVSVTCNGAYYLDPKKLVFWVCVQTEAVKELLNTNHALKTGLRGLLRKHRYPADACPFVHIGFQSAETVTNKPGN